MDRSRTSAKAEVLFFGLLALAALVVTVVPAVSAVTSERLASAGAASRWIVGQQRPNGAFFADTQAANGVAETLAAAIAGGASGEPVTRALDFIKANGAGNATRGAYTGRIITGIVAGGGDPRSFGGTDYVAILDSQYNPRTGAYESGDMFSNVLAAIGAVAANASLPNQGVTYIKANECVGGGFGYRNLCLGGGDVDTTSLAADALVSAGFGSDPVVTRARAFLLSKQNADGGFGFGGEPSSGDSTGLALTLINALGEDAQSAPWKQSDGDDPVRALLRLQDQAGAFKFSASQASGNGFSTVNAVAGMAGRTFPVSRVSRSSPIPTQSVPPSTAPSGTPPVTSSSPSPSPTPTPTSVDTSPPVTRFTSDDVRRTRDRTPTFRFEASEADVTFACKTDRGSWISCTSPFTVARLTLGKHELSVRATDGSGNVDPSPPTDAFKVVKKGH